ncbi:MAG: glycoside hydrolase family 65 protein [Frankiales bacterium]|nr:MAG: glycoside hydrolase family 65 protein [Frankiales bacterium]
MSTEHFPIEPWCLREPALDLERLARTESLFSVSNGHVGLRGNLDEGDPHVLPGSYLNSVYELRPLPYAEGGYGYPESGQSVINVTNGKLMRLLVDDEPFDVRYGVLRRHERSLDFRAGLLDRQVEWVSPAGQEVQVRSRRLVSLTQRSVVALCYEVEPVGAPARVVVQSELVADEELVQLAKGDPRAAAALSHPLESEEYSAEGTTGHLVHRTKRSGIRIAAAMDHVVSVPDGVTVDLRADAVADWARTSITCRLEPGQRLTIVKLVAYGWSRRRSLPAVRDQVAAALTAAMAAGWDELVAEQRDYLDDFWERADVEVDGDPELQQAVRFGLFHVLQAGARAERRPIAAKGLTGPGYDGHSFWDTETFVLPVLTHTAPAAAADVLRWRHGTLPLAMERAVQLGLRGAAFPWRTINGEECSGYWPAGTAAFHVNADIADALTRYVAATGDVELEREIGVDLLVQTARLWLSLGHRTMSGAFRIDGVTGPDEYSAVADNNVFTNLMAARNLRAAAEVAVRHPDLAALLDVGAEEVAAWRDAAAAMCVPYDDKLRVHPQSEGFTEHAFWDFSRTPAEEYPLMLHHPYFQLYRHQVVKQADLVLAMQLCSDAFTPEQKRRNVDYYEPLTVRDSSLSSATQAVLAAEVGYLSLAYDYAAEAALMDLHDLHHNTAGGLHMASLAGAWTALVAGFGGMRDHAGELSFAPSLPEGLDRLAFRLVRGDRVLSVEIRPSEAVYSLVKGDTPMTIRHHGAEVEVAPGEPARRPLERVPDLQAPHQPLGRAPARRRRS